MRVVQWMPEALARLDGIEAHIGQESPKAAEAVVASILARTRQLATVPESGRQVSDYQREDARELLERPYRMI